jgi:hypothetical protein
VYVKVSLVQVLPFPLQLRLTSVLNGTVYDAVPSTLGGNVRSACIAASLLPVRLEREIKFADEHARSGQDYFLLSAGSRAV